MVPPEYVFGYASLTQLAGRDRARPARLRNHRREWGVAMDNTRRLPRYKYYLDPVTRSPPAVYVVFLDLVPDDEHVVNGLLFETTAEELSQLDVRERNYARIDVTACLAEQVDGTVWSYVGSDEGRRRFADGVAAGKAVVHRQYLEAVEAGFDALGQGAPAEFRRSTPAPPCPARRLLRIDT